MTRVGLALLLLAISLPAIPGEFIDTFDAPDGTFPSEYTWTGDPRGAGHFEIRDNTFVHVDGGHVHYFRHDDTCGPGIYSFLVSGTHWNFAWRITPTDPDAGRCLMLYHTDVYFPNAYTLTEVSWWTISGYPEGQFMWHNGTDNSMIHYETGPLTGWHQILIRDGGTFVEVFADDVLIFEKLVEDIPDGYVGLGCARIDVMTPAFDFVEYSHMGSPVERCSWSRLKSLFE